MNSTVYDVYPDLRSLVWRPKVAEQFTDQTRNMLRQREVPISRQIVATEFYDIVSNNMTKAMSKAQNDKLKIDQLNKIFETSIKEYSKKAGKSEVYENA